MTDTAQRLPARVAVVGADTPVVRALPHRQRRLVGAWCFLDHAGPVQFGAGDGMHVGAHPHIGLQTFTWMIEGEVIHRDSLGNEQRIRPGQVNLMTAGHGIAHTEDSAADGTRLHAVQLWIALPDAERQRAPAFQHCPDLPVVTHGGFRVTVLAGSALGQTSPAEVFSPLVGLDVVASGAAATTLPLDPCFEHALLLLDGHARADGEPLDARTLCYWPPGRDALPLACDGPAHLVLIGGEPLHEDILLWWNLVARTEAELRQAVADWNAGNSRFAPVRPGSTGAPLTAPSLDGVRFTAS